MKFYIMNKDIKVAIFNCSFINNIEQIYIESIINQNLVPLSIQNGLNFNDWLNNRLILSHRKNISELFKSLGINTTSDILQITKGISLNDTYWIKPIGSRLLWRTISPYINSLNKNIADYSFDSNRKIGDKNISHSPDFSTSGNYPKCWKRLNGKIYLIKGGSTLGRNKGNEPFSELFSNNLLDKLNIHHINYKYKRYRGVDATICENMCSEDMGIYPLSYVRPDIRNYIELLQAYNFDKYLLDLLLFDYLSLNVDRHWGNISYFVENATQNVLGFTPIYDNNLSFLPYYIPEIDGSIDNYISDRKMDIVTADGTSFEDLFRMIDCKYIREKIKLLKGFSFSLNFKRNNIANEILQRQLKLIK